MRPRPSEGRPTIPQDMSAEYTNNHYVPQWYQRQFIPAGQADRELYLLDLKPEWFRDGKGVRRRRKALRRTGTRHCFAIDDLYTTRLGGIESRELERSSSVRSTPVASGPSSSSPASTTTACRRTRCRT